MDLPIFYDIASEWRSALFLYDSALKEVNTKLEILNNEFKLAHQYNPIEHITSRIKSTDSIAKKMRHNNKEITLENIVKYINDVAGIRIICSFTSDIYRISDLISKQSDVKVLKVKDYIMNPKDNGYTSYHMIISVPVFLSDTVINTKVEIQIRTIAMDFWASLEHKIYYKFEGNAPERIRTELKDCAEIVAYLDKKMLSLNEEVGTYSHDTTDIEKNGIIENYNDLLRSSYGAVIDDDVCVEENIIVREETIISKEGSVDKSISQENYILKASNISGGIEEAHYDEMAINAMYEELDEEYHYTAKKKAKKPKTNSTRKPWYNI